MVKYELDMDYFASVLQTGRAGDYLSISAPMWWKNPGQMASP